MIYQVSVNENQPKETLVGILSTNDEFSSATHSYELINGEGDEDNNLFKIDGDNLLTNSIFDYESENEYTIRVKSTSSNGGYVFEKSFEISINNLPDLIEDITLSSNEITENEAVGSLVGVLTTDDQFTSATHTYELVSGEGDADNASFTVDGSDLLSSEVFNYELKDTYSIRVRSTSSNGGYTLEKSFDINIVDVADDILDLSLSGNTIQENNSLNILIGTFSSIDELNSSSYLYVFTSGSGDDDNTLFKIIDDKLYANAVYDYEKKHQYHPSKSY